MVSKYHVLHFYLFNFLSITLVAATIAAPCNAIGANATAVAPVTNAPATVPTTNPSLTVPHTVVAAPATVATIPQAFTSA